MPLRAQQEVVEEGGRVDELARVADELGLVGVAERLGHDVKTLLGVYAHVIRHDDDRVRAIVDESLGGSAEDWLRTEAI